MLTILNVINYLVGKPLSMYVLILATIVVYYWVLSNYWETCYNNKIYLIIITILLLIDITMIIIIFTISHNYIPDLNIKDKKHKKKSKKNNKNKAITLEEKKHKETKESILLGSNNNTQSKNLDNESNKSKKTNKSNKSYKSNKSKISLYDSGAEISLKTYS
jgi:low affinity Fe/Cu permease